MNRLLSLALCALALPFAKIAGQIEIDPADLTRNTVNVEARLPKPEAKSP